MRLIQYAIILPVFAIFISISSDFKSLSLPSTRQGPVCIMVKLFTQYEKILDIPYYIEEKEIITDNIVSVFGV